MPIPFHLNNLRIEHADPTREAEFLRGLTESFRDVYVSILAITGNHADAEDVLQEVCVVLWQKFDEFEPGTSFRKWACAVAFNKARTYVRQRRRQQNRGLSDEALRRLTQVQTAGGELFELQRELLRKCLTRLRPKDRQFLTDCYSIRTTFTEYAKREGIPVATVFTRLKRLRSQLIECVKRARGRGETES